MDVVLAQRQAVHDLDLRRLRGRRPGEGLSTRKEVNAMRSLDLPDQSWAADILDVSADDDSSRPRSFHYGA